MNIVAIFLTGVGMRVAVSFLGVGYLKPHLTKMLTDVCGTVERAKLLDGAL